MKKVIYYFIGFLTGGLSVIFTLLIYGCKKYCDENPEEVDQLLTNMWKHKQEKRVDKTIGFKA